MIQIVTGDPRPIFRQIVDGVRMKIATGQLPAGKRLPSVRALAIELTVSINTVAKAYTQLTQEGLIESRHGVGVFVAEPKQVLSEPERRRRLEEAVSQFVHAVIPLGFGKGEALEHLERELDRCLSRPSEPTGSRSQDGG